MRNHWTILAALLLTPLPAAAGVRVDLNQAVARGDQLGLHALCRSFALIVGAGREVAGALQRLGTVEGGVGFGDVTPAILPGVIVGQTNTLVNPVTFSFGSTQVTPAYSGLAGNFVGLYEFFITVPAGLASGDYPIVVTQNGAKLPQTFSLTIGN